jgi:hypothetical protein
LKSNNPATPAPRINIGSGTFLNLSNPNVATAIATVGTSNAQVKAFVQGVTAAAVGAIAGAAIILGRRSLKPL